MVDAIKICSKFEESAPQGLIQKCLENIASSGQGYMPNHKNNIVKKITEPTKVGSQLAFTPKKKVVLWLALSR